MKILYRTRNLCVCVCFLFTWSVSDAFVYSEAVIWSNLGLFPISIFWGVCTYLKICKQTPNDGPRSIVSSQAYDFIVSELFWIFIPSKSVVYFSLSSFFLFSIFKMVILNKYEARETASHFSASLPTHRHWAGLPCISKVTVWRNAWINHKKREILLQILIGVISLK